MQLSVGWDILVSGFQHIGFASTACFNRWVVAAGEEDRKSISDAQQLLPLPKIALESDALG